MSAPFRYAPFIRAEFPTLVTGVLQVDGIAHDASVAALTAPLLQTARARLGAGAESTLPEIQAWRQAFAKMNLKPTQYRCAAEALLRRFRMEGSLPGIHPLVDLCNAVSLAFAVPIAAFDLDQVDGALEVGPATGRERYATFSGEIEHPEPGEVIFADAAGNAHARRWTNRQSGRSAVRDQTRRVLIVCEALHPTAHDDIARLLATLEPALLQAWPRCTVANVPLA